MPSHTQPPRITVRVSHILEPIYDQFLGIQKRQLQTLANALDAGDPATARRLAHSLKGSAATYELPDAAAIARDLEAAVVQNDRTLALRQLKALVAYFDALDIVYAKETILPDA